MAEEPPYYPRPPYRRVVDRQRQMGAWRTGYDSPAHWRRAIEVGEREMHSKWPSSPLGMIEQQLNNR